MRRAFVAIGAAVSWLLWAAHLRRRVPVILQLNTVECGAACLAMVLTYYRRHTTVTQCREVCRGGRGGVNAATIVRAARSYGLIARGLLPTAELYGRIRLPAILHWNREHFVVVERCGLRRVNIIDPAHGRRRLTLDQFFKGVGDAVLVFEPGPTFQRAKRTERSTLRLLGSVFTGLPGIRGVLGQVLLTTVLLQVLGLGLPVATKLIVDEVFGASRTNLIWLLGAGLLIALTAQIVTTYLRSLLLLYLQGRLDWQMLTGFARHLFRLPLRFFQQRTTGDLMTRLTSVTAFRGIVTTQAITAMLDGVLVLTYLVLMFVYDPIAGIAVSAVIAAQILMFGLVSGRAQGLGADTINTRIAVSEYLVQTLNGVATVKATGAEDRVSSEISKRIYRMADATLRRGHLSAVMETTTSTLRMLTPMLVLWLGAMRVLDGKLSVGTVLALTWLAAAILGPVTAILISAQRLQTAGIQIERLGDLIRAAPERDGVAVAPSSPQGGRIELRNISFRYDEDGPLVLRDVSASIDAGQRVAIVGRSGAGKTTLALLLLALYEPTEGEIRYDGVPLAEVGPRELRARFGVVLQDPFTLRATVRDNITLARADVSPDDVLRAAKIAEVHPEVSELPLGYDTWLAEHGVGLSGGQLQRLALARALVHRPSVLVLDEATSHLDAETEQHIVANLRDVSCTQIVIAHRLSTIQDADRIFVLRDGQLVESGTHTELLARRGHYADLVAAQLGVDAAEVAAPDGDQPSVQFTAERR
jgi:ATP-binding cassette subfamily B protein